MQRHPNVVTTYVRATDLPGVRPILTRWVEVAAKYSARARGDFIWNYHERAHTGFLAAAAWLSGGVALEEWRTEKRAVNRKRRKGRGDLWIARGSTALHIEAKQLWVQLGRDPTRGIQVIREKLRRASNDACDLPCRRRERRVGLVFVAPWIRRATAAEAIRRLNIWLQELRGLKTLATAWTIDTKCMQHRGSRDVTPGVALLIARAMRSGA